MSTPAEVCEQLVKALAKIAAPPPGPSIEDRLKTFTTYTTAIAALGATFYVFGFLIVNARLALYGIRSFSLADPAYAAAGASFFAVVAAPVILVIVAACTFRITRGAASRMMLLLFSVYFWVLAWMFFNPTPEGATAAASNPSFPGGGAFGVWVFSLLLALIAVFWFVPRPAEKQTADPELRSDGKKTREEKEISDEQTLKFALVAPAVIALLLAISLWARSVYPVGSPVVGGGRMPTAQIELKADVSPWMSQLLRVPAGTRVLPPMPILQDTDGMLTVVLPGQRALAMDRSIILSVQYAR